jgi:hypothetical protein
MQSFSFTRPAHLACAVFESGAMQCAWAANGAQPGGYGIRNAMMVGSSIALPLDSSAAANNPAGIAHVGETSSLNVQRFRGDGVIVPTPVAPLPLPTHGVKIAGLRAGVL